MIDVISLEDKYAADAGTAFATGLQGLVRVLLDQARHDRDAGLDSATYVSGYQGSPLGGLDIELGRRRRLLGELGITHQPAVNEELAASAIMGTQLGQTTGRPKHDGVLGVWYGKAPGLDRASDAIRHANLVGTSASGGAVALVGDDPAGKSSTVPCASDLTLFNLGVPVLYPGDVQDVLDLGAHAVALSRCSGLWTSLKIVTAVADGSQTVRVGPASAPPRPVVAERDGQRYVHVPSAMLIGATMLDLEQTMLTTRLDAARAYGRLNGLNRTTQRTGDDRIGIVAAGKTYFDLRQALDALGLDDDALGRLGIRLFRVGMPFPLHEEDVREFARGLVDVLVVEEKRPFLEGVVKDALYPLAQRPRVAGERGRDGRPLVPQGGESDPDVLARVVGGWLLEVLEDDLPSVHRHLERLSAGEGRLAPALPVSRTPYFCSGCPHNSSTKVPDDTVVGGGIGCHAMVMVMDPKQVGGVTGVTQMGGEGTQWIGMAPFNDVDHIVQNLGDGTFAHSGSLAVRAAVAAGVNITYKLLYNSAVAMTGGQHPQGAMTVPSIAALLAAEGVRRIIVTTEDLDRYRELSLPAIAEVWHRDRLVEAQELLATVEGVTFLIHDQECAAELRRKRRRGKAETPKKRIFINERVCEGCGDCGEVSNCLSVVPVETEFGRKTQIHQPSCNLDFSCVKGDCPSFIEVVPAPGGTPEARAVASLDAGDLPDPVRVVGDDVTLRLMGVGGTGVVTVSQVLAVAAQMEGRFVRGLDQTGLAQKGGPVVSDLKVSAVPHDEAGRAGRHQCDLYLGLDLLVAAEPRNLAVTDPGRTVAVLSTSEVATGQMVVDPNTTFPRSGRLVERVARRSRPGACHTIDGLGVGVALFGSDQSANMLLVGCAYQVGALPLSAEAIEKAIELNGVAVEMNVQAFRRGRQAIADPEALSAALPQTTRPQTTPSAEARSIVAAVGAPEGSALRALLERRVPELIAYQHRRYAARYAASVARVRLAEDGAVPGATALTEAYARNLFKLMAYKDEAEVARLHLDPIVARDIEAAFGPGARQAIKLHPPVLRSLGLKRKLTLGEWFRPALRVLYAARRVRGTKLDPFGYAEVRRVERELITEYEQAIAALSTGLSQANHAIAVRIAELPDLVRGYEDIKLRNVAVYRERLRLLQAEFQGGGVDDAVLQVTHSGR